jgi:single-strand DNA-binding protein
MDFNRVTICGNLGRDPEIRTFDNGGQVANFSVATTRKWKDKKGDKQEATDWHRVSVTAKATVGFVERFVGKGTRVLVEGELRTRSYDKAGSTVYITEVVVPPFGGQVLIQDRWKDSDGGGGGAKDNPYKDANLEDDIPY